MSFLCSEEIFVYGHVFRALTKAITMLPTHSYLLRPQSRGVAAKEISLSFGSFVAAALTNFENYN